MSNDAAADAAASLHRSLGDLVSLLVLPALWLDVTPLALAASFGEAVRGALDLDFVYVSLRETEPRVDLLRTPQRENDVPLLLEIRNALDQLAPFRRSEGPLSVVNPHDQRELQLIRLRISCSDEEWLVAAACRRAGFPTPEERTLLSLSANQAALCLERNQAMSALREARGTRRGRQPRQGRISRQRQP